MSTAEIESMLQVNEQQKEFYESRHAANGSRERAANIFTDVWSWMRRRQLVCRRSLGVQDTVLQFHRDWIDNIETPTLRILDLGCFTGNDLSMELAERSDSYLGIDLSEDAIAALDKKLDRAGLEHAEARAMDFLKNDFDEGAFDLIYAHSVLHHFRFFDCLMKELHRVCAPGGMMISYDPMKTSWSIAAARAAYRPLQSDKEWEFPFSMKTFRSIEEYFTIKHAQGVVGCAKYAMPIMLMPGLQGIGRRLCMMGHKIDMKRANRPGFFLRRCLQVTLCMQKPKP